MKTSHCSLSPRLNNNPACRGPSPVDASVHSLHAFSAAPYRYFIEVNIATSNILLVSRDTEHANTAETDDAIKMKRVLKCCEPDDEVPRATNPGAKAYMHHVSQGNRSHRSSTAIHKEVVRDMKECFKKPDCTGVT